MADLPAVVVSYFQLPENGKLGIVEMAQSAGLADLAIDHEILGRPPHTELERC